MRFSQLTLARLEICALITRPSAFSVHMIVFALCLLEFNVLVSPLQMATN
jgi:hypothetical protein